MYFQDDASAVSHYLAVDVANPEAFAMSKKAAVDAAVAAALEARTQQGGE